ncbi:MAG: chemotaxis protein CheW [Candidatus Competibacteraceae bacterium]|nr:chemotaxis protein CheW [Candidatus Competibacteraceae bacterium]
MSEIVEQAIVYPIPQTPPWLKGLINLRGNLVPVFDLRLSLKLGSTLQEENYLLLLGEGDDSVSFFVENLPQPVNTNHKLTHPIPLPPVLRGYTSDVVIALIRLYGWNLITEGFFNHKLPRLWCVSLMPYSLILFGECCRKVL